MTQRSKITLVTALAVVLLASVAWAQMNGGDPGPATIDRPAPLRGLPFAAGTVRAIDTAAGTVTLNPLFRQGQAQTVKITTQTQITAQTAAKISDLQVGEMIQVQGIPTGITASLITDSDSTDRQPTRSPEVRSPEGRVSSLGNTAGQPPNSGRSWAAPAIAQATGKITRLSPLTISLSPEVQVTLKAAPDLQVTRTKTEKIGDLQIGDRIMASGQPADDGTLTADRIRVNGYGFAH